MGRPKGSKNKEMVRVTPVVTEKPTVPQETCKECGDNQAMHYEGPKGWCNVKDCVCQEFK